MFASVVAEEFAHRVMEKAKCKAMEEAQRQAKEASAAEGEREDKAPMGQEAGAGMLQQPQQQAQQQGVASLHPDVAQMVGNQILKAIFAVAPSSQGQRQAPHAPEVSEGVAQSAIRTAEDEDMRDRHTHQKFQRALRRDSAMRRFYQNIDVSQQSEFRQKRAQAQEQWQEMVRGGS